MVENAQKKVLHCIVCGFERGGTTLVAELIRQHPQMDGRFEGGLLLVDTPRDFLSLQPYARNMKRFWGLSDDDLHYTCHASSWEEAYHRLRERSNLPDKNVALYDKTPAYMRHLDKVLAKVDVPCVCVVRDPRAIFWSYIKHLNEDNVTDSFIKRVLGPDIYNKVLAINMRLRIRKWVEMVYIPYALGLTKAKELFKDRILVVQHERLCLDPVGETRKIYDFLGLSFHEEVVNLTQTTNPYVARGGIIKSVVKEYQGHLTPIEQFFLLRLTAQFKHWHWDSLD